MPPAVIGPGAPDLCSPFIPIVVPLHGGTSTQKMTLRSRAVLYTGENDNDKLRLVCLPAGG